MKRGADDPGWTEIGRTDASEFAASGLHPERSYTFAVVPVEPDGSLAAEDEWETLRVAPTADEGTPALPVVPTGFAAAQDGPNVNLRWDAATDGVTMAHDACVGDTWEGGTRISGLTTPAASFRQMFPARTCATAVAVADAADTDAVAAAVAAASTSAVAAASTSAVEIVRGETFTAAAARARASPA